MERSSIKSAEGTQLTSVCIVCGYPESSKLYPKIRKCLSCGFVFADLNLTHEDFSQIYQRNYFFGEEYCDYLDDKAILQKNFQMRLGVLNEFLDPSRRQRLLEIGSAYGFFLELARQYFASVVGIDITEDGVRHAREQLGLHVLQSDLLDADLGSQEFDVVCMWDTIEHLSRPDLYIEEVGRHQKPGGLLAITTGDIGSFNARLKKGRWRLIHPPTHMYYFSKKTLGHLLNRLGYQVIYQRHCGFYRSFKNALYSILALRFDAKKLFNLADRIGFGRLSFYLNLYDILFVIARKK